MTNFLAIIGGLLLYVAVLILGSLLGGVIVQDAWGWFIEPFGLPPISLAHAIGLSMLVGYFKMKLPDDKERSTSENVGRIIGTLALMLASWGFMALAASFM